MHSSSGVSAFPTSQWSLIARASAGDVDAGRMALAELCRRYWYPIYAFVRRLVASNHDAEDITQGFFSHLLGSELIAGADRSRGRFRTYLLACCKNYIANHKRAARAEKRGGQTAIVAIDFDDAATRYSREPADPVDAEHLFIRRWALMLLEETIATLQSEYDANGRGDLFARLRPTLTSDPEAATYATIASELHMTEDAVRKAAQRMRERFRDELRRRIADTVESEDDIADEIRDLFAAVRA
jgi:RNA polymerase sigma-70 factor (ECF subfamily)